MTSGCKALDCPEEALLVCPSCERGFCGSHWGIFDGLCLGCVAAIEEIPQ